MSLVKGRYPVTYPFSKALGLQSNGAMPNVSVRSNAEILALGATTDQAAVLATGVAVAVAVPVEPGDRFTKISIRTGATAAGTPTNQFAALYTGGATPSLLGQSVDGTTTAIAGATTVTFTLAAPYTVQPTDAPNGYIYAALMVKATTVPSVASTPAPAVALGSGWFPGQPVYAQSFGSALTGTAPATISGGTLIANAPIVFLS